MRFGVSPEKVEELRARMEALGIEEEDLEERFVRGRGPGGQKVNKTSVAVHLRHRPSGLEVKSQETRSQSLNRFYARRLLADKLESQIQGAQSREAQRVAKIRRQKRRRSARAKAKVLEQKRQQSQKKERRRPPAADD